MCSLCNFAPEPREKNDNLELALVTARMIGILMVRRQLPSQSLFELVAAVGQRTNRKPRLVADDVALIGGIEPDETPLSEPIS